MPQSGGGGGGGAGGEAALGAEAKSIEDQLKDRGGQFDIEAITMQYPVVYEESMNTVNDALWCRVRPSVVKAVRCNCGRVGH